MKIWGISDTGLARLDNQDAYSTVEAEPFSIAVVCDGMGGTTGGSVASNLATDMFMKAVAKDLAPEMTATQIEQLMKCSVAVANNAIKEDAERHNENSKMGTTLVAAVADDHQVIICNIGDSRAYYINSDRITQVSHDHSVVEKLVENGQLTPLEAKHHPNRNLITRALGPEEEPVADCFEVTWKKHEFILLCTDGLVNTVSDMEILFEVIHDKDINHCLDRLVDLAKRRGAPDNVTAVLMMND